MKSRAWGALAALLPALAFATPAQAGTASIAFPATSVEGDGENVYLITPLAPGEPHPAVRIHAPSQAAGCTSVNSDPGSTIPEWVGFEGTTIEGVGTGSWGPREAGTYQFCVYFADGTFVEIDRQVIPPLAFTLTVTPGNAGSTTEVALNGTLSAPLGQSYGIELKYRAAGGLPCSPTPSNEPGTTIPDPQDSMYYNYWFINTIAIAIRGDTAPLAAGTYLLCVWEAPAGAGPPDLGNITLASSTTFAVGSPPPMAPVPAGATSPSASTSRALPRSVAPPSVTGQFRVGSMLRCSKGRWTSPPTISAYRWYRGAHRIAHAAAATYHITKLDSGRRLRCQVVIVSADGHSTSQVSGSHAVGR